MMEHLACTYRYRPGYGSTKYLLEFNFRDEVEDPIKFLLNIIKQLDPAISDINDLWQNDEVIFHITSTKGSFIISKDIWGFIFIMGEDNQLVLRTIDDILSSNPQFQKEQVDPNNYFIESVDGS